MITSVKKILGAGFLCMSVVGGLVWADAATNRQATRDYYHQLVSSDRLELSRLRLFTNQMPKGGDLHHHYTGSMYTETYLEWVEKAGWFINPSSLRIEKTNTETNLTIDELRDNKLLFLQLLATWSIKDFSNHEGNKPPPDHQFFRTFKYFSPISDADFEAGLGILKDRAKAENVLYLETMLERVGVKTKYLMEKSQRKSYDKALRQTQSQGELDKVLDELFAVYAKHPIYQEKLSLYVKRMAGYQQLIDDASFKVRFQTYGVRVISPAQVFLDLMSGYEAVVQSPFVVGVNLVAPEHDQVALDDYTLHMRMFNYLSRKMPTVPVSLHAGELVLGLVRPKDLKFHIREAIEIAGAKRIGHGVDISHESQPFDLLDKMKKVAVEINLSSNAFILGVKPDSHPYYIYKRQGVPMVISTDDSGVSRNNLSNEFWVMARDYQPAYDELKGFAFNSIQYSFASVSDKAEMTALLKKQFVVFEEKIATMLK